MVKFSPLTYTSQNQEGFHSWFDEDKGVNREVRYATNQNSHYLLDEQDDLCKTRTCYVSKNEVLSLFQETQPLLQQLLFELYHPKKSMWQQRLIIKKLRADEDRLRSNIEDRIRCWNVSSIKLDIEAY